MNSASSGKLSTTCPLCSRVGMMTIERKYATRPVEYDLCCRCGASFRATRPRNFWRWLKGHYRLTADELRRCQRFGLLEIFENGQRGELPSRAAMGASIERVIRYVESDLRPRPQT